MSDSTDRAARPSLTSTLVAIARGIGQHPEDPFAKDLVPAAFGAWLRFSTRLPPRALRLASLGWSDHITLRTRAIDDAIRRRLAEAPVPQVVILGAGLDARAYRLPELAAATVFEVDRPSAQAYKAARARVASLRCLAREVRRVPLDLERSNLNDALAAQGHSVGEPTFWICEGLTPYLSMSAIRDTLNVVGLRSARGSRLALTYATPELSVFGGLVGLAALQAFRAIGEPIHGLISPRQVRRELESVAYRVVHDDGVRDWAARFHFGDPRLLYVYERLVVADPPQQTAASRGSQGRRTAPV